LHCDNAQRLEFSSSINPYGLTFAELLSLGALAFRAMAPRAFPKRTFGVLDCAVRRNSSRRAVMLASFRRYPFCFPKGQLTSGPVSRPTDCSSGYVVLQLGVCRVAYRYVWTEKQSRRPHSSAANVALQLSSLPNKAARASTAK
jgi:hypothetical protein